MEYSAFPASLKVEISAVYTTIAQVRDINGPAMKGEVDDVTHRDSAGRAREFVATLVDNGELTFDIVYDPDQVTHSASAAGGMVTLLAAGSANNFRVTFADATPTTATFAAIVTAFTPKLPVAGHQAADVTVKITGQIVWA